MVVSVDGRGAADESELIRLLQHIVGDDVIHARWLNSLSYLENVGARKISASQDREMVTEAVLRHTVEEARHAWYLKRQLQKLDSTACPTYEAEYLLASSVTRNYINKLDVALSRLVKEQLGLAGAHLRQVCYQLVTYAIEVRADWLYHNYESVLAQTESVVSIRSILQEEEHHLAEMTSSLDKTLEDSGWWMKQATTIEQPLFENWITAVSADV